MARTPATPKRDASAAQKPAAQQRGKAVRGGSYFSPNASKAWGEKCFLWLSVLWISFFGGVVVTKAYMHAGDVGFFSIGLIVALPFWIVPLLFPGEADRKLPVTQRWWFKANVWIVIFSYVGNFFWTHYFYKLLGAKYTFPTTWIFNDVPFFLFIITHAYFCFYHTVSNVILRFFWRSRFWASLPGWLSAALSVLLVFVLSYWFSFMETFSIASVPYYSFDLDETHRLRMYLYGSAFYGIYFYVSFPMFYRLDENAGECWSLGRTVVDSLGASMLVTILLDLWRMYVGGIVGGVPPGLPFLPL